MTMPESNAMDCAQFQAQMADLIESGTNVGDHPHVKSCALCRELLENLEAIAQAAKQLFPEVEPPDNLWQQIELAIKKEGGA